MWVPPGKETFSSLFIGVPPKQCLESSRCLINMYWVEITILKLRSNNVLHNVKDMSFIHSPNIDWAPPKCWAWITWTQSLPQEVQAGVDSGRPPGTSDRHSDTSTHSGCRISKITKEEVLVDGQGNVKQGDNTKADFSCRKGAFRQQEEGHWIGLGAQVFHHV